jgi:hypothetical protein
MCAEILWRRPLIHASLALHVGIGLYGLQGMSSSAPEVRRLVRILAGKIAASEAELDAQALSNALYGMQVSLSAA